MWLASGKFIEKKYCIFKRLIVPHQKLLYPPLHLQTYGFRFSDSLAPPSGTCNVVQQQSRVSSVLLAQGS